MKLISECGELDVVVEAMSLEISWYDRSLEDFVCGSAFVSSYEFRVLSVSRGFLATSRVRFAAGSLS